MPIISTRGAASVRGFNPLRAPGPATPRPSLLMHFEGPNGSTNFVDATGKIMTASATGATISTSATKFGTSSGLFNVGIVTTPDAPDLQFGSGDFTIDLWIQPSANVTSVQEILTKGAGLQLYISSGNVVGLGLSSTNSAAAYFINQTMGTAPTGVMSHIAVVKAGNVYSGYVNGVRGFTVTTATIMATGTDPLMLGDWVGRGANPYPYRGYMAELRVVKGLPLFSGPSFPVPTAPYTYP